MLSLTRFVTALTLSEAGQAFHSNVAADNRHHQKLPPDRNRLPLTETSVRLAAAPFVRREYEPLCQRRC